MAKTPRRSRRLAMLFVPTAIALAACGSDDSSSDDAPATPLSLSGTAATGAAIAGGAVDAKCADGSGQATTGADGSYSLSIPGAALPCVLRVSKDGTVLHSLATGSGRSAVANLTPASELVVARLASGDPAAFYGTFDGGSAPDATQVQAAVDAVIALLKDAGVDLSGVDVLGGALVAAHGSTPGNAFDQALDALKGKLADAGVTLAELRGVAAGSTPAVETLNATPSLPVELKLRAAAPNCAALRSGRYRLVFLMPGSGGDAATDTGTLDAPTLRFTSDADGESAQLSAVGDCRYALPNGGEMVVSSSGAGVLRSLEDGVYRTALVLPVQQHPVSALAGTWNFIALDQMLALGEITVDAGGRATAAQTCTLDGSCTGDTPDARETFVANGAGGFDYDGSRAFAYRSGGGELMVVLLSPDGSFALATRKVARALPTVGAVTRSWNISVTPQFTSPAAGGLSENTIVSLASDGASFLRSAVIDFNTGATRPETVQINVPRDGFNRRVPQTVTTSTGGSSNVGEWVVLALRGTGITPVGFPSNQSLTFSVNTP